ncbi:MAG: hypothetical protein ACRDKU_09930 [Gaiellaceae bacterium]
MTLRIALLLAAAACLALPVAATATGSSTPAVGTHADATDLSTVEGAQPFEGGYAVPLKGERPAWYTDELAARVEAAEGQPVAAPGDAPLPGEVGIRPGSWMIAPSGCTMNFVFRSGSTLGIGTAGHCVDGRGDSVVLLTVAPGGSNPVLVDIGTVVKHHDNGIGDDFALVSIRPELYAWVFPTMAVVGGPCGAYTGPGPETVWHYGHGLAIGTGGTPRAGVGLRWGASEFGWVGAAIFGDSGSGVRVGTGLAAAGDLTHLVVNTKWLPNYIAGTRISKMLSIAGGGWTLASSPLCV